MRLTAQDAARFRAACVERDLTPPQVIRHLLARAGLIGPQG